MKLCNGKPKDNLTNQQLDKLDRDKIDLSISYWSFGFQHLTKGIKRPKLTCSLCGRRVYASVAHNSDGDYMVFVLPPHKPKFWWKKK